jgi:hypothetical protein
MKDIYGAVPMTQSHEVIITDDASTTFSFSIDETGMASQ